MSKVTIKAEIDENITQNGNHEITGPVLNGILKDMVDEMMTSNYKYAGVAALDTDPETPSENVFYIATEVGEYENFLDSSENVLSVAKGEVAIFKYGGPYWSKEVIGGLPSPGEIASLELKYNENVREISGIRDQVKNYKPIEIIGDVTNAPDEEDITSTNGLLKIKNRSSLDGMGYVILRKDKTFAEQVTEENTIYEIRYDFNLGGAHVAIPDGCTLKFDGGKLTNATILGHGTNVMVSGLYNIFKNIILEGTWADQTAYLSWWDIDENIDSEFNSLLSCYNHVVIDKDGTLTHGYINNRKRDKFIIEGRNSILKVTDILGEYPYLIKFGDVDNIEISGINIDFDHNIVPVRGDIQVFKNAPVVFNVSHKYNTLVIDNVHVVNYGRKSAGQIGSGVVFFLISAYKGSTTSIDGVHIKNCYQMKSASHNDGLIGMIQGIRIKPDGEGFVASDGMYGSGRIQNCVFEDINNIDADGNVAYDDGNAIYFQGVIAFDPIVTAYCPFVVDGCTFTNVGKSCIKIQANGVTLTNNAVFWNEDTSDFDPTVIAVEGNNNLTIRGLSGIFNGAFVQVIENNNGVLNIEGVDISDRGETPLTIIPCISNMSPITIIRDSRFNIARSFINTPSNNVPDYKEDSIRISNSEVIAPRFMDTFPSYPRVPNMYIINSIVEGLPKKANLRIEGSIIYTPRSDYNEIYNNAGFGNTWEVENCTVVVSQSYTMALGNANNGYLRCKNVRFKAAGENVSLSGAVIYNYARAVLDEIYVEDSVSAPTIVKTTGTSKTTIINVDGKGTRLPLSGEAILKDLYNFVKIDSNATSIVIHNCDWIEKNIQYNSAKTAISGQSSPIRVRTEDRPTALKATDNGYGIFDTTLAKPIYWTGSKWVDASGADV